MASGAGSTADVVVAGAGPAGCSAAIALAQAGWSVLLADPCVGRGPPFKIGETLPAAAVRALRDLGLAADRLPAAGALPCTGTTTAWGAGPPLERSPLADPYGYGWHLDRVRFDALLRAQARAAGVRMVAAAVSVSRSDGAPRLVLDGAGVACRQVVDATGRRAAIASKLGGARRARDDRLVAVHAVADCGPDDRDARTRVEATAAGWWYSALVGGRRRVVAFLTDADLLDRRLRSAGGFATALAATRHVVPGGVASRLASRPATTAAHGARLVPPRGPGWVAVGDAALAFDPLSSQGILNALATGLTGAGAVDARLRDAASGALARYEERLASIWEIYTTNRSGAYALEDRWPGEPFWARRHGAQ